MKKVFELSPQELWKNFHELTQIPRPSKKEEQVMRFLVGFGLHLGLETITDDAGNVIIRKPATPGMENRKGVILQSHMDMVPQKNSDKVHDFEKDPIETVIDGEWVRANGTTLGADNGMGVAAALAVLESTNIAHGPIEALFTVDEETGLTGAFGIKPGILNGSILLNLDSEDEGKFCTGCAGGTNAKSKFFYANMTTQKNHPSALKIKVTGLSGGHSAVDIHRGKGNAIKLLVRILWGPSTLGNDTGDTIELASINGGTFRNAIPTEASAVIVLSKENEAEFKDYLLEARETIKNELAAVEPNFDIVVESTDLPTYIIDTDSQSEILNALYGCPNGVIRMSDALPGLTETSINLAIVKTDEEKCVVEITCLLRSSVNSAREDLKNMVQAIFKQANAEVNFDGEYPGWKPNPKSEILDLMKEIYKKKFGEEAEVTATHGGLECGLLGGIYPHWDMISFGPTICFPHSPDEKVNIESVQKFWDFLVEILENIPVN